MRKIACIVALFVLAFNLQSKAQKGDPWIYQAYQEEYHRQPTAFELNIKNYNNGSWNNYGELKNYIKQYQAAIKSKNIVITLTPSANNTSTLAFWQKGVPKPAVSLI